MAPEASRFASVRSPALPRPSPSSVVTPDHAGDASGSREKQKKGGQRVRDSRGSRRNGKSKEKIFNKKESSNISSNESTTTPGSTPRTIEDTSTADSSDHFVSRSGATGRSTLYVRGHSDAASEPSIVSLTNLIHHIESLSADLRDSPCTRTILIIRSDFGMGAWTVHSSLSVTFGRDTTTSRTAPDQGGEGRDETFKVSSSHNKCLSMLRWSDPRLLNEMYMY